MEKSGFEVADCGRWTLGVGAEFPSTSGKPVAVITLMLALMLCSACQSDRPNSKTGVNQQASKSMSITPISGPVKYLALGDSTGVGIGARNGGYVIRIFNRILAERPGSTLANLCVSGATSSDVLEMQLDRGLISEPNLVTLGIGINDIGHGFSVEEFAQNYEQILSTLRSKTQARIIVCNIPDISSAPQIPEFARARYQQAIVAFNQRLEAIASRYGVTVFDVHSTTRDQLPSHPEFFSSDGFHPSDAGYELWAREMWPVVARSTLRAAPSGSQSVP